MDKYKVMSTSKRNPSAWVIERKNLTKIQAKQLAKKLRGWYFGLGEGSHHKKVGVTFDKVPKKYKKKGDLYRLYVKIIKMRK